ncbi:MAG: hypothetical protein JNK58_04295 [Phycisphaerae bacterium]|nr:hypothetical protein [Phycisphaerae bacterium]
MKVQFILVWLILARTLLGACCGPKVASSEFIEREAGCACCCGPAEVCDSGLDTAVCVLCAACEGRVPTLPPVGIVHSLAGDWLAVLSRPDTGEPEFLAKPPVIDGVDAPQVSHGVAWIERLRPIVCVWTI